MEHFFSTLTPIATILGVFYIIVFLVAMILFAFVFTFVYSAYKNDPDRQLIKIHNKIKKLNVKLENLKNLKNKSNTKNNLK